MIAFAFWIGVIISRPAAAFNVCFDMCLSASEKLPSVTALFLKYHIMVTVVAFTICGKMQSMLCKDSEPADIF